MTDQELYTPIERYIKDARTYSALVKAGYRSMEALSGAPLKEIRNIGGVGEKGRLVIQQSIMAYNLSK